MGASLLALAKSMYYFTIRCEKGCKSKKMVIAEFSNFLQTPNYIFCRSANRALSP